MADTANTEDTRFSAGEKFPLLGVSAKFDSPWLRFGLPVLTGLAVVFVYWLVT